MSSRAVDVRTEGGVRAGHALPHFAAIDGLRAWLAWGVVLSHVVQLGLANAGGGAWVKLDFGGHAVNTFIIISGFVITHLLIERPGGYLPYIVPRFMRLFPAFITCWIIGIATYWAASSMGDTRWFEQTIGIDDYRRTMSDLYLHIVGHVTMLHGAIPNSVLPSSEYAFLPPGWSMSLEWQFYLLAPFVVWLCRTRTRALVLVLIVVFFAVTYHAALKDQWDRPAIVIGTGKFFLIGIGCRFAAPHLAGSVRYVAAVGLGVGFTALWAGSPALAVWLVLYCYLMREATPGLGADKPYLAVMRFLFESAPVRFLAERSYSTYLLHWPVIMLVRMIASFAGVVTGPEAMAVTLLAFPLTLVLQEPMYRLVELPGRALGKRWAEALRNRPGLSAFPAKTVASPP